MRQRQEHRENFRSYPLTPGSRPSIILRVSFLTARCPRVPVPEDLGDVAALRRRPRPWSR
jgi:hypothetical protein